MNSINVTRFIKLQKVILKTYEKAAEAAARRSGISVDEAEALIYLYEKPEHKGKLTIFVCPRFKKPPRRLLPIPWR